MNEGYIKFRALVREHHLGALSTYAERLDRLNHARSQLYSLNLIGMNADGTGFGNISMRFGSGDSFVVSGSATGGKMVLDPQEYCEILSFDLEGNEVTCNGSIPPSSETMSHGAVYRSLPAVQYVIHVHHRKMFEHMLEQNYPHTAADAAYGTPRLALEIARCVLEEKASEGILVMTGHQDGILAWGVDLEHLMRLLSAAHETVGGS